LLGRFATTLLIAVLSACSGGTGGGGVGETDCQQPDVDYSLSQKQVEHACGHLEEGPYGELVAGDELTNLHMLYTVQLEALADGGYEGSLGFTPRASSTHVFYVFEGAALSFADEAGESLCVAATIEDVDCAGIERAQMIDLVEGQRIELRLTATSEPTTRILAERR
jgi:hypothetical protein